MCILSILQSWLQDLWIFINSNFFTTLLGTASAAFAGTYGAQYVIEKSKIKEELKTNILRTNVAIMAVADVFNALYALKNQHVKALKDNFDTQKKTYLDILDRRAKGQLKSGEQFVWTADYKTVQPLKMTAENLQRFVIDKIVISGLPLILLTTLIRVLDSLNDSMQNRNALIEQSRKSMFSEEVKLQLYFGLPNAGGHIDQKFPDSINALSMLTDDGMFFSEKLCLELMELAEKLAKNYGKGAPKAEKVDFKIAHESGLMPNETNYPDWIDMKKKATPAKPL